jgi:protein-tyrosine phosphatase
VVNVLFVCLGNICRSPAAEGVFRALVQAQRLDDRIGADSAGIAGWQIGRPPDPRARSEAQRRGFNIGGLRARQIESADFSQFDYILAMDRANHAALSALCPPAEAHRLALFLDFAGGAEREVADPYYGGREAFARMFDLIEDGARGLLAHIVRVHL